VVEQRVGARLRVLSYNVHGQRDDVEALAAVVRAVAPDVVTVQEGPRRFRWRHHAAALAERLGLVVVAGGLPSLGNLILSSLRVRVHRTWCRRYPLTPGRHMRGAVFAECSVGPPAAAGASGAGGALGPGGASGPGGARFVVAGSHLATDPADRPGQATLFRAELARIRLPLVAGADLNDTPKGEAWRIVADGLVDAAVTAGCDDRLTYPCADPRRRIDAIFVDPRIAVAGFDVLDTEQARRASDHFPVLADLIIPPPP
jgi:endonuclease/exonuclease/phosphatase family metal-dependent hydrolase